MERWFLVCRFLLNRNKFITLLELNVCNWLRVNLFGDNNNQATVLCLYFFHGLSGKFYFFFLTSYFEFLLIFVHW